MKEFIESTQLETIPINTLYGYYLLASYLYYVLDQDSPWTDYEYDRACRRLLEEYDCVTHRLKHLTNHELLRAGSGYTIPVCDYPQGLRRVAEQWRDWGDARREEHR